MERHNSIFKVVFFALAGLVALLIFSVIALVLIKGVGPDDQAVIYVMIAPLLLACGKGLQSDFMVCPYCGASQELLCPGCGVPTSPEWNMCPHCGHNLKTIES